MNKTIHIVCLDAPSPPDYGGAIDMYYKIKALALEGHHIILHYFDYKENRGAGALTEFCKQTFSYKRKSFLASFSFSVPYIVKSRINQDLIERLNQDDHPILLEGLHCTGIIPYLHQPSRVVVRMHNEEESYYRNLQASTSVFFKKIYFSRESQLIRKYQEVLKRNIKMACLSEADIKKFRETGFTQLYFIPCFIPWRHVTSLPGRSNYCLYHGNMAIAENERSAIWLMENIFNNGKFELVIAGNRISGSVKKSALAYSHIRLVDNPSINALEDLIKEAHINVLPSMNNTGVKLKLLHALLNGRFCITNQQGMEGSGISTGVEIAETPEAFRKKVEELMAQTFQHSDIGERRDIAQLYNNSENAKRLSALW